MYIHIYLCIPAAIFRSDWNQGWGTGGDPPQTMPILTANQYTGSFSDFHGTDLTRNPLSNEEIRTHGPSHFPS